MPGRRRTPAMDITRLRVRASLLLAALGRWLGL
jgi:hypothetical protein